MRRFRRRRSVKGSKAAASTEEIVAEVEDEPAEDDEDEDLEAELAEFKKTRWALSFFQKLFTKAGFKCHRIHTRDNQTQN